MKANELMIGDWVLKDMTTHHRNLEEKQIQTCR